MSTMYIDLITCSAFVAIVCIYLCLSLGSSWPRILHKHGALSQSARLPVWIPLEGYWASIVITSDGTIAKLICRLFGKNGSPFGATNRHHVVYKPSMVTSILRHRTSVVSHELIIWNILCKIFGGNYQHKIDFAEAYKLLDSAVERNLLREEPVAKAIEVTLRKLEELGPTMLSFSPNSVDQNPWERSGYPCLPDEQKLAVSLEAVEVSLFPLIRNFVGHVSIPALMGAEFMAHHPSFLADIWDLDDAFNLHIVGMPKWLPVPLMQKSSRAQARLKNALTEFHMALDASAGERSGVHWGDMSDVSSVIRDRGQIYRDHEFATADRGPQELGLLWAMNANANSLVFWILVHMWAVPELVEEVRREIDPFTGVLDHKKASGSPLNTHLKMDSYGITRSCPILKACYFETLRLTHEPTSIRHIQQDLMVRDTANVSIDVPAATHMFKAGSFVTMAHGIHQRDPKAFPNPKVFDKDRFLTQDPDSNGRLVARASTLRPWGGGYGMCKGRIFAEREVLLIVAGTLALWDFTPVDPRGWRVPEQRKATGVNFPAGDLRVVITRRQIP